MRPDLFESRPAFVLGVAGLVSDFDKFLGQPGLLHSLLTIVPLSLCVLAIERYWRGGFRYGPLVVGLMSSHLLLDVLSGGPVPLLYPLVKHGIGLTYPVRTVFGVDPVGVALQGPVVQLRTAAPRPGFNTYGFVDGYGVISTILFGIVVIDGEFVS